MSIELVMKRKKVVEEQFYLTVDETLDPEMALAFMNIKSDEAMKKFESKYAFGIPSEPHDEEVISYEKGDYQVEMNDEEREELEKELNEQIKNSKIIGYIELSVSGSGSNYKTIRLH